MYEIGYFLTVSVAIANKRFLSDLFSVNGLKIVRELLKKARFSRSVCKKNLPKNTVITISHKKFAFNFFVEQCFCLPPKIFNLEGEGNNLFNNQVFPHQICQLHDREKMQSIFISPIFPKVP